MRNGIHWIDFHINVKQDIIVVWWEYRVSNAITSTALIIMGMIPGNDEDSVDTNMKSFTVRRI